MSRIVLCFSLAVMLMAHNFLWGQSTSVKGTILEPDPVSEGKLIPVIGANVYHEKYPNIGSTTDINGKFELQRVEDCHKIVVSFIGFQNDTIDIQNHDTLELILSKSVELQAIEISHRKKTTAVSYMKTLQVQNIGEEELQKAACCNLSESFETNPSIDVSFTDAVTGTRTIQMLGLSGPYIQMTTGNMPDIRGLTAIYGMEFIPGTWVESIQLIKGTGTVVNGYESMAGQINTELKSPDSKEKLIVNGYGNQGTRLEANLVAKTKLNENWGANVLIHGKSNIQYMDRNKDNFADMPLTDQAIVQTNFRFANKQGWRSRLGFKVGTLEKRGGQLDKNLSNPYLVTIKSNNGQFWAKSGKVNTVNPNRSSGLQISGSYYDQKSSFGNRVYNGTHSSVYINNINQRELVTTKHILKAGVSFLYDNYTEQLDSNSFNRVEIVPGVFTEYTFDPNHRFTAVLGGRVDYHNLFGLFVTPRLHWRYEIRENTVLRGTAGRGQRTASILSENVGFMASSRRIRFKSDSTMNAYGLSPEVSWNFGLSLSHNFELNYKEAAVNVDFYRTDFVNQVIVDLDENPGEIWFYNLDGSSYSNSFQAQVDYELFKRFDVRVAYRWFDVVSTYNGVQRSKPLISSHRGFVNLAYSTISSWKFDMTAQVQGAKRIPTTLENPTNYQVDGVSPVFYLINGQISKTWFEKAEIYVGVENLLNFTQNNPIVDVENPFGEYFDSSLVWGPIFGRNIYFGFRYKIF